MSRWENADGGKKRKESTAKYRRQLKLQCFKRDGWQELIQTEYGLRKVWFAYCSFGCGVVLWLEVATLDHYPIPYRLGGEWELDNLRLACHPCNTEDGGPHGRHSYDMPPGLTNHERIQWYINQEKESARLNGMHGIPIDKL